MARRTEAGLQTATAQRTAAGRQSATARGAGAGPQSATPRRGEGPQTATAVTVLRPVGRMGRTGPEADRTGPQAGSLAGRASVGPFRVPSQVRGTAATGRFASLGNMRLRRQPTRPQALGGTGGLLAIAPRWRWRTWPRPLLGERFLATFRSRAHRPRVREGGLERPCAKHFVRRSTRRSTIRVPPVAKRRRWACPAVGSRVLRGPPLAPSERGLLPGFLGVHSARVAVRAGLA